MTKHTPNATRYPIAALVAGLVGAAGVAGALFLLGVAPVWRWWPGVLWA